MEGQEMEVSAVLDTEAQHIRAHGNVFQHFTA